MATESENKLAELELNIKTAIIECERVESIVTALDASIAEAQQTHAEHYQKTDAEQCDLNERKRLILAALAVEKDKLHEMELLYPEAVRAVDLDHARKELTVFMELSAKLAASVVKLAVLNEVLDGAIFYHESSFVLPKPYLKPFCDEADPLLYHQSSGQVNCITDTLRSQIIAAGGMRWSL